MFSASVISKLGQIAAGSSAFEDMKKEGGKAEAAKSGLGRALKVIGIATAGGAAVAGAHSVGKSSGRASGMEEGRKAQLQQDQDNFRQAVPRIFSAGRMVQARHDAAAFKGYLDRNNPGTAGTDKNNMNNKDYYNMNGGSSYTKTASAVVEAVVDGWSMGKIKTADVKALPSSDMQKVAAVLVSRMNNGDEMAGILWRTLCS